MSADFTSWLCTPPQARLGAVVMMVMAMGLRWHKKPTIAETAASVKNFYVILQPDGSCNPWFFGPAFFPLRPAPK
jgi:hypothetical protein